MNEHKSKWMNANIHIFHDGIVAFQDDIKDERSRKNWSLFSFPGTT